LGKAYTYLRCARSQNVLNHDNPTTGEPRASEARSLMTGARQIVSRICKAYHGPIATLKNLQVLANEGTNLVKQLLELGMRAARKLVQLFDQSNHCLREDMPVGSTRMWKAY